jgi:hypothetical protein
MSTQLQDCRATVPERFQGQRDCYLMGYRAGREMNGGFRLNLEAMRYEPVTELSAEGLAAWTEGFRAGFIQRREAGEILR